MDDQWLLVQMGRRTHAENHGERLDSSHVGGLEDVGNVSRDPIISERIE